LPFTPVALLDSRGEPTASVSPESATVLPKVAFARVFDALRYACCDQTPAVRVKT
jgi:hypothetical protein